MRYLKRVPLIIPGFLLYAILLPQKAYAYLDPGTISYAFQVIVLALVSGVVFVRVFWNKIKYFFTDFFSKKK